MAPGYRFLPLVYVILIYVLHSGCTFSAAVPDPLPESTINPTNMPALEILPQEGMTVTPTLMPIDVSTTHTHTSISAHEKGWLDYENDLFGYRFNYPPEARIRTLGVTAVPADELPEDVTLEEYLEQLSEEYPGDLCVSVSYKTIFVIFVPAAEKGGKYTGPCGVTGVGDYEFVDLVEVVQFDNQPCTAYGWRLQKRGGNISWQGEFYFLKVNDTITIHFGSMVGTETQFRDTLETLRQIVTSFQSDQGIRCDAD